MFPLDAWEKICCACYRERVGCVLFEMVECVVKAERDVDIESRDGLSPAYWRNHEYDVAILQRN